MKIKKTEQILQLFDDRSAHSGSNKKTQAVHTILMCRKRGHDKKKKLWALRYAAVGRAFLVITIPL